MFPPTNFTWKLKCLRLNRVAMLTGQNWFRGGGGGWGVIFPLVCSPKRLYVRFYLTWNVTKKHYNFVANMKCFTSQHPKFECPLREPSLPFLSIRNEFFLQTVFPISYIFSHWQLRSPNTFVYEHCRSTDGSRYSRLVEIEVPSVKSCSTHLMTSQVVNLVAVALVVLFLMRQWFWSSYPYMSWTQ